LDEILLGAPSAIGTFFRTLKFTRRQKLDVIVATNYNNSLAALLIKIFRKTKTVVAFHTDYLPPRGPWHVRLHRRVTTWLMEFVARYVDEVWVLSPRIKTGEVNPRNFVVPICITERPKVEGPRQEVAYIGLPSHDHALDILFEICKKNHLRLNVVGDSPYLQSIKHLAPADAVFYGMINDEERISEILSRCFCGYAIYRDVSPNSYSYYGFPSKTLYCFANNVPIVITAVAHFNPNFAKHGVGLVVEPVPEKIEAAVLQLKENYPAFSAAIDRFRTGWNEEVRNFHRERFAALEVDAGFKRKS